MGYQWLSYCSTHLAWQAYEGLMSRVDAEGKLGGESLPSRKAQTAWVLYKRTGDRARLEKVYPAVKRYLLWREANLRWIWKEHDYTGERDLEFVVSWLADIDYARQIAAELKLADDVQLWKGKVGPAIANMREWFFGDEGKVHQYAFVDRKTHTYGDRDGGNPIYVSTALAVKRLPADMLSRVQACFRAVHWPDRSNAGFPYTKYPPNNFVATGLLDHGMPEARPFVEAILRDSIRIGEFAEVMLAGPKMDGVRPSLFTPLNIIEFTWLLNGVRVDSGEPAEFKFPKGGD